MERKKGIAYCGLACAACSESGDCPGCRNEGCKDKESCKHFSCCREKKLSGCWECPDFPCADGRMHESPRIRGFAAFVRQYGTERLLDCLERNKANGVQYHYPGQPAGSYEGDYDQCRTREELFQLLLTGARG